MNRLISSVRSIVNDLVNNMEDLEFRLEDEYQRGLLEYSLENDCDFI